MTLTIEEKLVPLHKWVDNYNRLGWHVHENPGDLVATDAYRNMNSGMTAIHGPSFMFEIQDRHNNYIRSMEKTKLANRRYSYSREDNYDEYD